jgi:hypothetical protein
MTGYSRDDLSDLADVPLPTHPVAHPGGVAFYLGAGDAGLPQGALLSADAARRIGAQLLIAAEQHDQIADTAVDRYREQIAAASPIHRVP